MDEVPLQRTESENYMLDATINPVRGKFVVDTGSTGLIGSLNKRHRVEITRRKSTFSGVSVGDEENGKIESYSITIASLKIRTLELALKNRYSNSMSHLDPDINGIIGHDVIPELHGLLVAKTNDDVNAFIESSSTQYIAVPLTLPIAQFTCICDKDNWGQIHFKRVTGHIKNRLAAG